MKFLANEHTDGHISMYEDKGNIDLYKHNFVFVIQKVIVLKKKDDKNMLA